MMFIFIGIVFKDSVVTSSFIFYFVIQRLASVIILFSVSSVSYRYIALYVFHFFAMVKMAIFPFFLWYYNVVKSFSSFSLFLVLSPQKLSILYLVYVFNVLHSNQLNILLSFSLFFIVFSMLISSLGGLIISDLKSVLIWSSLVNSV